MAKKQPTVSITLNAKDQATRVLNRVKGGLKKFATISATAITAAATATAVAVNRFAASGDTIAKTARQTGLTAEALQELQFAADRSGISADDFTKSMQQMNKFVGQARAGTGALTSLLKQTNPALLEQLKTVENSDEAFELMVSELNKMGNQMDKAALANAAWGRSGQAMLIMAEEGVEGIRNLREEARKYGGIIDNEAAAASERFIDSMTNLKASLRGVAFQALGPLVEKFQPLIQRTADFLAQNQELINQKIDRFFDRIGDAVEWVSTNMKNGLIPAAAFFIATMLGVQKIIGFIKAYQAATKSATAAQIALNMASQVFSKTNLIVLAISAIVAVIFLLIYHWDKVTEVTAKVWQAITSFTSGAWQSIKDFTARVWDSFSKLLDNPLFAVIGTIFAPWLTLPALIVKHWEPLMKFFAMVGETVGNVVEKVNPFDRESREKREERREERRSARSANSGLIRSESLNRSELAVSFAGAPEGTTFHQSGRAPGITVSTGAPGGVR